MSTAVRTICDGPRCEFTWVEPGKASYRLLAEPGGTLEYTRVGWHSNKRKVTYDFCSTLCLLAFANRLVEMKRQQGIVVRAGS